MERHLGIDLNEIAREGDWPVFLELFVPLIPD